MLLLLWLAQVGAQVGAPAGSPCVPRSTDCALDLHCADPLGTGRGTCRRSCSEARPCAPHEICFGLIEERFGIDVGECWGDRCRPGHEAEACGGPATCVVAPPASLCGVAGPRGLGEACSQVLALLDVGKGEGCRPGLLCVAERCVEPCEIGRPCPSGSPCLTLDAPAQKGNDSQKMAPLPFGWCEAGCDPVAGTGCPSGQACVVHDVVDAGRRLTGQCEARPTPTLTTGAVCTPEGPACPPSDLCAFQDEHTLRCTTVCAANSGQGCPPHAVCAVANPDRGVGLCMGACDPLANTGCPAGRVCTTTLGHGRRADGSTGLAGECVAPDGLLPAGAPCPHTLGPTCQPGLICLPVSGDPVCTPICGTGRPPCPPGRACYPTADFFAPAETSLCLPEPSH